MEWNFESVIFYILLLDATVAVFISFSGKQSWWNTLAGEKWSKYFPIARGWVILYLLLVLFIGHILGRYDILTIFW